MTPLYDLPSLFPDASTMHPLVKTIATLDYSDSYSTIFVINIPTDQLNRTYGPFQLSLLMILVIKGHTFAVKALLKNDPLNINHQDARGFTVLHHAAVGNQIEIQALLTDRGVDQEILSRRHGTASDYQMICHPALVPNELGFCPVVKPHWPAKMIVADWLNPGTTFERTAASDEAEALLDAPVALEIEESDKGIGLITKTAQRIDAFQPICLYSGIAAHRIEEGVTLSDHEINTECTLEGKKVFIDGKEIGNWASRIMHATPNTNFETLLNVRGLPSVTLVRATEVIEPEMELRVDYGPGHPVQEVFVDLFPALTHTLQTPYNAAFILNTFSLFFQLIAKNRYNLDEIKGLIKLAKPALSDAIVKRSTFALIQLQSVADFYPVEEIATVFSHAIEIFGQPLPASKATQYFDHVIKYATTSRAKKIKVTPDQFYQFYLMDQDKHK